MTLPRTALDVLRLAPRERLLFGAAQTLLWLRARGRYPLVANGDLEEMTFWDKAYWLHKAARPLRHARRGSGLDRYFQARAAQRCELPREFEPESTLELSAVGDLMNHPFLPASRDTLYAQVEDAIFGVDVAMANLECVLFAEGAAEFYFDSKRAPPLRFEPESFAAIQGTRQRRYTFLAAACNHSLDFGPPGVASTIRTLRAEGIAFHGVNESALDADRACLIERRGVRLALLSHTFGLNGYRPPPDQPWLVNRTRLNQAVDAIDFTLLQRQLAWARAQQVDATIVQLHWGLEFEYFPSPDQVAVAHHLAELGADVVIGHHPHVVQPSELYRTRRDPERQVPIFYSLGNLVNPFSLPELCRSAIARITLAKGRVRGGETRTYVQAAQLLPVTQRADEALRKLRLTLDSPTDTAPLARGAATRQERSQEL